MVAAACREQTPTSIDSAQLPSEPTTLELQLPWSEFGDSLEVFGGYSIPRALGAAILANDFVGELHSRSIVRFGAYPQAASVVDPSGTTRTDTNLSFFGGRIVVLFDTIASTNTGPVTLQLGALQNEWDANTATWTFAVDSVGDQRPWPEPGGGPIDTLTTRTWDPAVSDSVSLFLDSAQIAAWGDLSNPARGARIELLTPGERLFMLAAFLRLDTRSSLNPDTVLILSASADRATFLYDPPPPPPADGFQVGGAPAWRSVLNVTVPAELTGPPELCSSVGCPFALRPEHVSFAGLGLRSRKPPDGYQPTDSLRLDVRPVLSRAALPKSPLGASLIAGGAGKAVPASAFGAQEGELVEIPITSFVRAYLAGPDPSGRPPPNTLALLSLAEPSSFTLASFHGPDGAMAPVLNLIVTVSTPLELP